MEEILRSLLSLTNLAITSKEPLRTLNFILNHIQSTADQQLLLIQFRNPNQFSTYLPVSPIFLRKLLNTSCWPFVMIKQPSKEYMPGRLSQLSCTLTNKYWRKDRTFQLKVGIRSNSHHLAQSERRFPKQISRLQLF